MPDFNESQEPDEESFEIAQSLTRQYISALFEERQYLQEQQKISIEYEGLFLGDINTHLTELYNQLIFLEREGGVNLFPCLNSSEGMVPVNIFQFISDHRLSEYNRYRYRRGYTGDFYYDFRYVLESLFDSRSELFGVLRPDSLRENVNKLLSSFLATRIAATSNNGGRNNKFSYFQGNKPPSSGGPPAKYLTITLNTSHAGLQIEASPAFFISWTYFGHPTTPLTGPLSPGRYIFAGKGVSLPVFTIDPTVIKIPPHLNISLHAL